VLALNRLIWFVWPQRGSVRYQEEICANCPQSQNRMPLYLVQVRFLARKKPLGPARVFGLGAVGPGRHSASTSKPARLTPRASCLVTHDQNEALPSAIMSGVLKGGHLHSGIRLYNLCTTSRRRLRALCRQALSARAILLIRGQLISPDTVQTELGLSGVGRRRIRTVRTTCGPNHAGHRRAMRRLRG